MNWKDKCVNEIKARRDVVVAQIEQGNAELRQIDDTLRALGADGGASSVRSRVWGRQDRLLDTLREAYPNGVTNVQLMAGAAPREKKLIGQSLQELRQRKRVRTESNGLVGRYAVRTWFYVPTSDCEAKP